MLHSIAKEFGCKNLNCSNNRNLNINKSFAMDQAKGDWIFYLDADEELSEQLNQEKSNYPKSPIRSAYKPLL